MDVDAAAESSGAVADEQEKSDDVNEEKEGSGDAEAAGGELEGDAATAEGGNGDCKATGTSLDDTLKGLVCLGEDPVVVMSDAEEDF